MLQKSSLLLVAASLLSVACNASVISGNTGGGNTGGGNTGGSNTGGGNTGGGNTGGGAGYAEGIAVAWSALGPDAVPAPADTLLLSFSSEPSVCSDPFGTLPYCEVELAWQVSIPLPAEYQFAGAVVPLTELQQVGMGPFFSETEGVGDAECSGGGGTLEGTLEVLEVGETTLRIRLSDASTFAADVDGERTLTRCNQATPQTARAIAMSDEQLSNVYGPGGGTGSGVGGGADQPAFDGTLFVFLDASAPPRDLSCADPYALDEGCEFERRVVIVGLDPSEQSPGLYAIGDNAVSVSTSEYGPNGDGTCWGGGGAGFNDGTVEVVALDDTQVRVIVSGGPIDGQIEGTASRCF
jgi:hypothetical protein